MAAGTRENEKEDIKKELDNARLEADTEDGGFVVDGDYEAAIQAMLPTTDDVNTPSFSFRVLVLGTLFCVLLSFINQLMTFRTTGVTVSAYLTILFAYPMGKIMALTLPTTRFNLPFLGECSLNPGPFSIKETALIYIMGSTGTTGVFGTDNLFVQKYYYGVDVGAGIGLLFLFTTMLSGFGIAGLCYSFLVRPAHMIWPSALPQVALFRSFHAADDLTKDPNVGENGRRHMGRLKFFFIVMVTMMVFQFIPGWLAPALSSIGLLCLFSKDPVLQLIGSPSKGAGVMSLTIDWTVINSYGNPLTVPFWVQVNVLLSWVIWIWILTPLSWSGNWFHTPPQAITWNTSNLVNSTGDSVGASDLVDPKTNTLSDAAYQKNAPIYMSPYFAWSYFTSFVQFTACLSHALVWYGKDIVQRLRKSRMASDRNDIHCQLIDKYPAIPRWWFIVWFIIPTVLGIIVCSHKGIDLPWYYTILSIAVSIVGTIPFAIVLAVCGVLPYMGVISEFLIGCLYPGYPIAGMAFKCFGVTVSMAVTTLLQDLKVSHYMKVPPRHVFAAQMYSQAVAVLVCYATLVGWTSNPLHVDWILNPNNYTNDGVASMWAASGNYPVYYNASLIWGAIGPIRFFFTSYLSLVIAGFTIGAVMPVVLWFCYHYIGGPIPWQLINVPIIANVQGPGISGAIPLMGFIASCIFQFGVYRYRSKWWQRYNYVFATALDVGSVVTTILIVFLLAGNNIASPKSPLDGSTSPDFCPNAVDDKTRASMSSSF
ncbi:OPT superfamily [Sorochytrium milnesiophthora]